VAPNGTEIPDDLLFSGPGTFGIYSLDAVGPFKIDVDWDYDDWVYEYKLYYGTSAGSYTGSNSPVIVQGTGYYQLGNAEVLATDLTYYIKIEAYDNYNNLIFESPEDSILLSLGTIEYPENLLTVSTGVSGEIKVFWDSVSGVDGYYVYYGESSQTYNTSGSPLDITDPSATQAVISGLFDSTLYYITVEAYIGTSESNNPLEVSDFPGSGSGSLTSAPATISPPPINLGTNMQQQTLALTNNGASAVNVRFELDPLIKSGGDTIPPSNYTISPVGPVNIAASGSINFSVDLFIPGGAVTGNYAGNIKFYDDANNNAVFDTGEGFADVTVLITVSGGGGGTLTAAPATVTASASAGGSIPQQSTNITNNGAAVDVRFVTPLPPLLKNGGGPNIPGSNYTILPASVNIGASSSSTFTIDLAIPGGQADGNYSGPIKFYRDDNSNAIFDAGEDFIDVDVDVSVGAAPTVDHIRITSVSTSSTMGSPIFVTLTAEDINNNTVSTFQTDVDILVNELTSGELTGSWHLSTNDGPRGKLSGNKK